MRFDPDTVPDRLEVKSCLHRGVRITFVDRVGGERVDCNRPGAISEYLATGRTSR